MRPRHHPVFDETLEEFQDEPPKRAQGNRRRSPRPTRPRVGGNQTVVSGSDFDPDAGYSSETDRARIFCDLIYMAMACDMTRVATLMLTTPLKNKRPPCLHGMGESE
ncbi:MAG: DUF1552 domain-containing protein [Bradymonadaceae bacterium]